MPRSRAARRPVRLGGRTIWSDATLDVAQGEFVAVLGPNGSGKSTLLRVLLGDLPLSAGTMSVHGTIGYLRSDTASTRRRGSAGSISSRSASTAPAGGCHCFAAARSGGGSTRRSHSSARRTTRAGRSASSPAESSSGC
jgi:ABC-type Mn/Zn transport systems, ATPase component